MGLHERVERRRAELGKNDGSLPPINGTPRALLDDFARELNSELVALLHVFATDEPVPAARGSHADVSSAASSGMDVPAERLAYLFTQTQIEKLRSFIHTRQVPARLFNGDDVGGPLRANAQQRILIAGHILSQGTSVPHPEHWVPLVHHYAGVAQGGGRGVIENFDHTGGLSLSVSETMAEDGTTEVHGTARSALELDGKSLEEYATLQPGDWLWLDDRQSVIFSRWASAWHFVDAGGNHAETGTAGAIGYRRAITMSQTGAEVRLLGGRRVRVGEATISPVTRIVQVDASARPLQRMEDVLALLGHDARTALQNERFLERLRGGGNFDTAAFFTYLRTRNEALIVELSPHMTPLQQRLFREANTSEHAEHGTLGTLVRLNQRLTNLVHDASALGAHGQDASQGREDARVTGLLADLTPSPTWAELITPAE